MEPTVAEFSEPPVIRYHIRRQASNDQSTGSQDCASRIASYGSATKPVTEMEINHAVDMPHSPYSRPLASSLTLDSLWNEKKKKGKPREIQSKLIRAASCMGCVAVGAVVESSDVLLVGCCCCCCCCGVGDAMLSCCMLCIIGMPIGIAAKTESKKQRSVDRTVLHSHAPHRLLILE